MGRTIRRSPLQVTPPATDEERISWVQLWRTDNIGPMSFFTLLNHYKTAQNALSSLPYHAQRGGTKTSFKPYPREKAEQEFIKMGKIGGKHVFYGDPSYPTLLTHIPDPAPVLTIKGRLDLLHKPSIGLVGARNASLNGKVFAQNLSKEISQNGYNIVSGLARGIDAAAHEGALVQGTIAVIANGLEVVYPSEHEKLYEAIASEGLILSEVKPDSPPHVTSFPKRNRLIAGISYGTIIVEAALKSGSMITAERSIEYGRDVFVVPGSPLDPRYHGSHKLIQNGAALVQNAQDILHNISLSQTFTLRESSQSEHWPLLQDSGDAHDCERIQTQLLSLLTFSAISIDELVEECHLSVNEVMTGLLELELAGRIIHTPGHHVMLKA